MISRITGRLVRLSGLEAYLLVGAFEHQVLVPDFVRRKLQSQLDQEVSLRTIEYIEGNPQKGGRMVPRLVGFLHDVELEFFEMICSVDGVGVKKALNAMVRPVREVAAAIEEQELKVLAALPGIGPAMAERIVAKLRRKMAKFALLIDRQQLAGGDAAASDVLNDGFAALCALGHTPHDARELIERASQQGKIKSVDELIQAVYRISRQAKA